MKGNVESPTGLMELREQVLWVSNREMLGRGNKSTMVLR